MVILCTVTLINPISQQGFEPLVHSVSYGEVTEPLGGGVLLQKACPWGWSLGHCSLAYFPIILCFYCACEML